MSDEISFNKLSNNTINKEIQKIIEKFLEKKEYNHSEARNWNNQIVQNSLKYLSDLNNNFKYVANCVLMQKSDFNLSVGRSVLWDSELDGEISVNWENDEILCILTIYGVSL